MVVQRDNSYSYIIIVNYMWLLQLILPHMVDHTFMAFPVPLQTLWTPWTIIVPLMFPRSSLKNLLFVVRDFWSLSRVYTHILPLNQSTSRRVQMAKYFWSFPWCGSKSLVSWPSICLKIARIWPSITPLKHYIRNHLDTLRGEELKSKKTIIHYCRRLIILESASLYPLENFVFFTRFPLLASLLSRDGGLRWLRPRWRTQFLRFADMPIEVVIFVIFDLY